MAKHKYFTCEKCEQTRNNDLLIVSNEFSNNDGICYDFEQALKEKSNFSEKQRLVILEIIMQTLLNNSDNIKSLKKWGIRKVCTCEICEV